MENVDDLEDGEIEDDDDDVVDATKIETPQTVTDGNKQCTTSSASPKVPVKFPAHGEQGQSDQKNEKVVVQHDKTKFDRRSKYEEKKKSHLTEAEKSVMYLHKLERIEREKRDKYRREPGNCFGLLLF